MTSLVAYDSVPRPSGILTVLVTGYVALLPFQFEVGNGMNFAPADCLMLLVLLLAAGQLKYRKPAWTIWHFGIPAIFAAGSLVAAVRFGALDRYELLNKDAGLLLPFLSYAAITSAVTEWDDLRRHSASVHDQRGAAEYSGRRRVPGGVLFRRGKSIHPLRRPASFRDAAGSERLRRTAGGHVRDMRGRVAGTGASVQGANALDLAADSGAGNSVHLFALRLDGLGPGSSASLRAPDQGGDPRLCWPALLAAPCLLLLMGNRFLPVFEEMASRPKQVQGRFDLIHDALQAFTRHPIFGGGIGSFRLGEGEIAHNSAMWFLADFGIVGLTVLLGFLGWFFVKAWYAYRFAPAREQSLVLALLLAHTAMFGLAMGIEAFYQRHWWLVLGLIASSYSLTLSRVKCQPRRG